MAPFFAFLPVRPRKGLTLLITALGLGLLSGLPTNALAQMAPQPGPQREPLRPIPHRYFQIDTLVQKAMDQQQWVGLAVGLVEDGQISYLKGYGWADKESREAVTLNTSFRWASLSKPVTAVLSLQLVEQGKLDLDQDIRSYWRSYKNAQGWKVTQRQLLSHLSGVGHYDEVPHWGEGLKRYLKNDAKPENGGADMVAASRQIFASAPLLSRPGTQYHYSTFGAMLAGAVLSQAGGMPYLEQFQSRIAQPLGLTSIQPDRHGQYIPYRASGYYRDNQVVKKRLPDDVAWKLAGGGFTSNIYDLTRFMQALINQELLSPASTQALWQPQSTLDGKPTGYGLSFGIGERDHQPLIEHSGSQTQTRTWMGFMPQEKRGVVLMSNSEWADFGPLQAQILDALRAGAVLNP